MLLYEANNTEEPCARKPHAGICEGAVGKLAVLPRCAQIKLNYYKECRMKKMLFGVLYVVLLNISSAYGNNVPTIHYGYPASGSDLGACLSSADKALTKSGYETVQSTKQHVLGTKGEYVATIICATYKNGVAFIVVNGKENSPMNEEETIQKAFTSEMNSIK